MTYHGHNRPVVAGPREYSIGQHYEWECALHEAEAQYYLLNKEVMSLKQSECWLEKYLSTAPPTVHYAVRTCEPCSQAITDALMRGESPWLCPEEVKAHIKALAGQIGGKVRTKRHIDEFA